MKIMRMYHNFAHIYYCSFMDDKVIRYFKDTDANDPNREAKMTIGMKIRLKNCISKFNNNSI